MHVLSGVKHAISEEGETDKLAICSRSPVSTAKTQIAKALRRAARKSSNRETEHTIGTAKTSGRASSAEDPRPKDIRAGTMGPVTRQPRDERRLGRDEHPKGAAARSQVVRPARHSSKRARSSRPWTPVPCMTV